MLSYSGTFGLEGIYFFLTINLIAQEWLFKKHKQLEEYQSAQMSNIEYLSNQVSNRDMEARTWEKPEENKLKAY